MSRIQSTRCSWGGIEFDSKFEREVFLILKDNFSLSNIKIHQPLIIRPKTRWFEPQSWKIDYQITNVNQLNGNTLYVEAKGFNDAYFKERLKNLSYFLPLIFENLVIVTTKRQTLVRGLKSVCLKDFQEFVKSPQYLVNHCKKEIINVYGSI